MSSQRNAGAAELLISIGGLITSIVVVAANALVVHLLDFDVLSLTVWFIVPAGAACGGLVAASGYYVVATWTQSMPTSRLLFNMVAIGVSTWLLYNWVEYYTFVLDDGTAVRDIASFGQYFALAAEHTQLTIRARAGTTGVTTGELGTLGYVREALQALGFMGGGFAMYALLADKEVCHTCRRYVTVKLLIEAGTAASFDAALSRAGLSLPGVVDEAMVVLGKRRLVGLDLALLQCPLCTSKWIRPALVVQSGENAERIRLRKYLAPDEDVDRLLAAAAESIATVGLQWSALPAYHERHLQRRWNNGAFARERQQVSEADVLQAQQRDEADAQQALAALSPLSDWVSDRASKNDGGLGANDVQQVVEALVALVERGMQIGGAAGARVRQVGENILDSVESAALTLESDGGASLSRAIAIQRQTVYATEFLAQLHRQDSPIPPSEIVPALIMEDLESFRLVFSLKGETDRHDLAELAGVAMSAARKSGRDIPDFVRKVDIIREHLGE